MSKGLKNFIVVLLLVAIGVGLWYFLIYPGKTYYAYSYDGLDKTRYFTLKNGKWTDETGLSGDYEKDGTKIVLRYTFMGMPIELSGTLEGEKLTLSGSIYYTEKGAPQATE